MDLKFVKNLSEESATMLLYKEIGNGIDGALFAEELYWLSNNFPLVNIRINSPGGSVFDGFSIFSAMREVNSPVDTYNDFMAASMAGVIFQGGRKRYAAKNSLLMMHNVSGADSSPKDLEIIDKMKGSIMDVFTNRTGVAIDIVSYMMDVETWLEGEDQVRMGFADANFDSVVGITAPKNNYDIKKLYAISNNILNKPTNKMADETKPAEPTKDSQEAIEALKKAEDVASKATTEAEELKKKLAEAEAKLKEVSDVQAVELVENSIKDGKFKADAREKLLVDAKANPAMFKNLVDSMPASVASRFTNYAGSKQSHSEDSTRESWTYKDWETKDNKGLQNMFKNDNEQYNNLLTNWKNSK